MVGELARRIVVRHREAGYLRLELPAELCHEDAGTVSSAALRAVDGVYRVEFQGAARRLVIAYDEHLCSVVDVARALKTALADVPVPDADVSLAGKSGAVRPGAMRDAIRVARHAFADLRGQVERLRRTQAAPGSLQARLQPVLANALTEKAVTNFLNDLIAFYLVRVHWQLITQRWLKEPVKHADAWLAVFYLMFLLVRYRKSLAAPSAPSGATQEPAMP